MVKFRITFINGMKIELLAYSLRHALEEVAKMGIKLAPVRYAIVD